MHILTFSGDCPVEVCFHSFSPDHQLTPSYHDHLEITYIFEGRGTFTIEDKKYNAHKDDIFIIGNTEFHRPETHDTIKRDILIRSHQIYKKASRNREIEKCFFNPAEWVSVDEFLSIMLQKQHA